MPDLSPDATLEATVPQGAFTLLHSLLSLHTQQPPDIYGLITIHIIHNPQYREPLTTFPHMAGFGIKI